MEENNSLPTSTILKGLSYTYRIEKTLGQGSFGITYLASVKMAGALGAIDTSIKVAIKEFFMRDINGRTDSTVTSGSKGGIYEDYKKKFKREAINLSKLQHPNIIKVIESFEANNTVYYVMEYMGGGSLDDYIAKHSGLKEDEAIKIVKQIASALSFMHEKNMLHLDLKPSNIMRKESGDVVLIDFGLSKQYDANGEPESSTKVGAGTPGYAPLEQANYREGKGFPVTMDVYALGATMFKMLTGVRPPEASDILNDGFPLYELQERGISEALVASVVKAMAPMKKERCQSVAEFMSALGRGSDEDDREVEVKVIEETPFKIPENQENTESLQEPASKVETIPVTKPKSKNFLIGFLVVVATVFFISVLYINLRKESSKTEEPITLDYSEILTFTTNGVSFKMVPVEGGTFQMGCASKQSSEDDEMPVHSVTLSNYYIGQTEVTQALWQTVMGSNPSNSKGDKKPVENVSWNDCQNFIRKLNLLTGQKFRLLTEAEWEYAARGGNKSKSYKYSGSNDLNSVAWYWKNSGNSPLSGDLSYDKIKSNNCRTHYVATKHPNELGLYDMSGNVREWCQDWYGDYSSISQTNPSGPSSGSNRVFRGGSWNYFASDCRVSGRDRHVPTYTSNGLGLRLALSE